MSSWVIPWKTALQLLCPSMLVGGIIKSHVWSSLRYFTSIGAEKEDFWSWLWKIHVGITRNHSARFWSNSRNVERDAQRPCLGVLQVLVSLWLSDCLFVLRSPVHLTEGEQHFAFHRFNMVRSKTLTFTFHSALTDHLEEPERPLRRFCVIVHKVNLLINDSEQVQCYESTVKVRRKWVICLQHRTAVGGPL